MYGGEVDVSLKDLPRHLRSPQDFELYHFTIGTDTDYIPTQFRLVHKPQVTKTLPLAGPLASVLTKNVNSKSTLILNFVILRYQILHKR